MGLRGGSSLRGGRKLMRLRIVTEMEGVWKE